MDRPRRSVHHAGAMERPRRSVHLAGALGGDLGLLCGDWTGPLSGPEAPEEASPSPRTKATEHLWSPAGLCTSQVL